MTVLLSWCWRSDKDVIRSSAHMLYAAPLSQELWIGNDGSIGVVKGTLNIYYI